MEKISTRAAVHFESSRGIVHRLRVKDGQDRSQLFSRGYEAYLYWDTARVFELGGTGTSSADWEEVFDNCTSLKEQELFEAMSGFSEGAMPWVTVRCLRYQDQRRKQVFLICKPSALEHKTSAIRKELEVGQALLDVFKRREHYGFKRV